jgi:hypothetical protein
MVVDSNSYPSRRVGGEPEHEVEHFYVCAACGQAVDMRRLGDVFHHEDDGHLPIGVPS